MHFSGDLLGVIASTAKCCRRQKRARIGRLRESGVEEVFVTGDVHASSFSDLCSPETMVERSREAVVGSVLDRFIFLATVCSDLYVLRHLMRPPTRHPRDGFSADPGCEFAI